MTLIYQAPQHRLESSNPRYFSPGHLFCYPSRRFFLKFGRTWFGICPERTGVASAPTGRVFRRKQLG